jgi:hypothetical protein
VTPLKEAEFKSIWLDAYRPDMTDAELAFTGGGLADELALLFIAGYQAAVRSCFPVQDRAWTVFAVSEDHRPDNPLPGLRLNESGRLNGSKTWVACCDQVDDIVVSADRHGETLLFIVSRDQPGLTITRREGVGFLSGMSQGTASFTDVKASQQKLLPPMDLKHFARREPLYLYIAFCGFMLTHGNDSEIEAIYRQLSELSETDLTGESDKSTLADIDNILPARMQNLVASANDKSPEADRSLITLYSKTIQKRAGRHTLLTS